jgi:hypothetical protein
MAGWSTRPSASASRMNQARVGSSMKKLTRRLTRRLSSWSKDSNKIRSRDDATIRSSR